MTPSPFYSILILHSCYSSLVNFSQYSFMYKKINHELFHVIWYRYKSSIPWSFKKFEALFILFLLFITYYLLTRKNLYYCSSLHFIHKY